MMSVIEVIELLIHLIHQCILSHAQNKNKSKQKNSRNIEELKLNLDHHHQQFLSEDLEKIELPKQNERNEVKIFNKLITLQGIPSNSEADENNESVNNYKCNGPKQ